MTELQKTAINDLQEQHKTYQSKYGRKEKIIAQPTLDALINFCEQSEEFAEAVHDSNNTFSVCLSKIIENKHTRKWCWIDSISKGQSSTYKVYSCFSQYIVVEQFGISTSGQ